VYESHFDLLERPFGETVDPAAYVPLPGHDAVLRRLRYALVHHGGPAILFGPPGSGKTLLARRLSSELPFHSVHLTFPALPPADLLAYLAHEFADVPLPSISMHVMLHHLRDQFARLVQKRNNPFLIIDDAHLITEVATFDTLRLLQNFASDGRPDLRVLFVGGAEMLLELPAGLTDRLAAHCLLGALTEEESIAYITGRSTAAGGRYPLFSQQALSALHRAADGLPRRLNRLADLALLIAYAKDLPLVDDAIISIAAHELHHAAA
jgi:type II secretory pathway predicted ATPase ExeA